MLDVDTSIQDLVDALPAGVVLTDTDGLDKYRWDRALDPAAERPLAVVRAESTEHVQVAMRWAAEHRVPVVPRGAGTGLSGGASALANGIVLCTERMRAISIDPMTRLAVVQPGLLNAEVKRAVAEHGLWYPPDPSSYEICSIGGNIATNAGGLCCVKYGVTADYVLGMQVVLGDGRAVRFGGPRLKDVAGLSLHKLFVGSEGTLGVITEVTLRLLPAAPSAHTLATWFATTDDATAAILDITSQIRPSMLEYMDRASINAVEDELHMGLDRTAAALLVARTDSGDPRELEIITAACERHHATEIYSTADEQEGELFVAARRAAIPAVEKRGRLLLEDVGVPLPRLPDLVAGIEKIAALRELTIALIAHAGDGNTHPLIVFDPSRPEMAERAQLAFGEIMDLAIALGGTITGEHGVGRMKQPWLEGQVGADVLDVTRRIKQALDPLNILNPGPSLSDYVERSGLAVDVRLADFVEYEAAPAARVDPYVVWSGLARVVAELAPRNRELLGERARLQDAIDAWHRERVGGVIDADDYRAFLVEIGYLVPGGEPFTIDTEHVDAEIATLAGPQLVVPASNARYALNAANARWGSLYDALYGTDALGSLPPRGPYDDARGSEVVAWARAFLDRTVPLASGSHADATHYSVVDGHLVVEQDAAVTALADPDVFTGYVGEPHAPTSVLLTHHGLGIEIVIDPSTQVGRADPAGVSDVVLESAVTTIVDFEDSVAAVDAEDKVTCYRNWLGLLTGELSEHVSKGRQTFTRRLNPERSVTTPDGGVHAVRPHALLLARNVGHLMTTPAVRDSNGHDIPEGLLDAVITVLAALVDVGPAGRRANSPAGSIYIVKPKMHGADEVAFADDVFTLVEEVFELTPNTVKIGIMDEERRTTVNLAECIRAARSRVAFINTGFLDRTGDEIHTSMLAGPMVRKADMRSQPWITAYEDNNVDVGLACGLQGRAQIGKGMWAAPERMRQMLAEKGGHPRAGASCAWVPSPTAATLHATHYHQVDVAQRQSELAAGGALAALDDLLTIPIDLDRPWSQDDIDAEIENNAQGILGYVVRWVDQGVGCSKVPDIHGVELMEDRATCRISSQHIANWLHHDVVTLERVDTALRRMAAIVDEQNAGDPLYVAMAPSFDGEAFRAARDLIVEGLAQPAGYTEPLLHAHRQNRKLDAR